MRFLVGYYTGKTCVTFTTSKEYKNSKYFYSWLDEDDKKMVDIQPIKHNISPEIYDLCTILKLFFHLTHHQTFGNKTLHL